MKFGTMVMLLVAIVAGGVAAFSAKMIIQKHPVSASAPKGTIVVAASTLNFGTVVTDENIVEIPWPADTLPEGAFKSKAELQRDGRRVVLTHIAKDEPVLATRVTGPGQRGSLSVLIGKGMRAVTVRVDDVRGVAGFVLPEDHVDILLSRVEGGGASSNSYTDVLLQNVKVLAVDQIAGIKQEQPTVAKAVTLEVTPEQSEKLVLASGVGSLSLVLRQAGGAEPTTVRRVTLVDLGQGEYNGAGKTSDGNPRRAPRVSEPETRLPSGHMMDAAETPSVRPSVNVRVIRAAKSEEYDVFCESR